ncbi:MAG: YncE family protein [Planctomycetota bacterium]|jgi:YVTN family beta-propeller protein
MDRPGTVLRLLFVACIGLPALRVARARESLSGETGPLGPVALAASPDGGTLYVANLDARQVAYVDIARREVMRTVDLPAPPTGLALGARGKRLYVTCAAPRSTVAVIDTASCEIVMTIAAGHTATGPAVSPDGRRLYVCNRFDDDVSVIDLVTGWEVARVPVSREPVAAAVTPDGRTVVVGNHLPAGPSTGALVRADVTLIDAGTLRTTTIPLPDGAINVRGVCVSPDGGFALVTHVLGSYILVASQVEMGWINSSSLSVIDLRKRKLDSNFFLDEVSRGAADPWGVAYAAGGGKICVAHSGTHELSVIDTDRMLEEIRFFTQQLPPMNGDNVIRECRRRVKLPGKGPRDLVVVGSKAYVSEYFSDMISVVDLDAASEDYAPSTILLGPEPRMSKARRGEMLFHDATFCYQHWQSCASCHTDGRSDALNWDLLNDEAGTPRNTKSLLFAHRTPPAMVTGVRATAEVAVRAGIKHILFVYDDEDTEDEAQAIDAYLKSLRPVRVRTSSTAGRARRPGAARPCSGVRRSAARRATRRRSTPTAGCTRSCPPRLRSAGVRHADARRDLADRALPERRQLRHAQRSPREGQARLELRGSGRAHGRRDRGPRRVPSLALTPRVRDATRRAVGVRLAARRAHGVTGSCRTRNTTGPTFAAAPQVRDPTG